MSYREEVLGAVARGWCSKENENKTMDVYLAEAITDEIMKLPRFVGLDIEREMSRAYKICKSPQEKADHLTQLHNMRIGGIDMMPAEK
jgi:hypothetical protein